MPSINHSVANKDVSIGGKGVITDWREAKIISPENLQEQIKANESAREEIEKQTETVPASTNAANL